MDTNQYFSVLATNFERIYAIASEARARGKDPEKFVEIKPSADFPSRVEGIIGIEGLAEMIRSKSVGRNRQELAFEMAKEICINERFAGDDIEKRLTTAVRVGLAVLTDGVVVAPTEGVQGVRLHKTFEGSDYIAIVYAGPIRGAGGTSVALSVAIADYCRRLFGIGAYKAAQTEVERYIEEILLYNSRSARLQYPPNEYDIRTIIENCQVCIDGVPTEQIEVSIHRNMMRLDREGKEEMITNKIRGGIGLVTCEGVAQKAKSVLKFTKSVGLDWSWLNNIIKVEKLKSSRDKTSSDSVFLQELVAGRPVLAYPGHTGGFRLRYGRSRMTGIAAKGISPATMLILDDFIACGTQLRIERPGKGCVTAPVDTIEGPFVKLHSGEALRINTAEKARELRGSVAKIISVGDILITYGDFKKTNTLLQPTSYVEEYWQEQLKAGGYKGTIPKDISFKEAFEMSEKYGVPMHPRYIYDYAELGSEELLSLARALAHSVVKRAGNGIFGVEGVEISKQGNNGFVEFLELLCTPHRENANSVTVERDDAQSLLSALGFVREKELEISENVLKSYETEKAPLEIINSVAPFRVMKRSTWIGGRVGRPEKAKERLMKPAPHVLFPIGEYGGKERSIVKAYNNEKRKFQNQGIEVEIVRYRCSVGGESVNIPYCRKHKADAVLDRICTSCGRSSIGEICQYCGGRASASGLRRINLAELIDLVLRELDLSALPKVLKGVKGLTNKEKMAEPIEKGILRSNYNVYIFKDGTSRFDATDMPMTHFYPKEIATSVERLRELGYEKDYLGMDLTSEEQLVELRHQDIVINRHGGEYLLNVARFVDELLVRYYKLHPFYNAKTVEDLVGQFVITLSPHTSCGVLCRVIGFSNANVGFAHPYTISARRRNCDGDEDTCMLLLDALINFSRSYLPTTIGGTMDAPLILTLKVEPKEVDDEVHDMEVVKSYDLNFYDKTFDYTAPGELEVEMVRDRIGGKEEYSDLMFTHLSSVNAIADAPSKSIYTRLKTMQEKVELQFRLMDRLSSVDKADTAKRLILSHFIPDLIGNMHSFSRQNFRCVQCNAKYRRVPLLGRCTKCDGKLVLTISKGNIEKYLNMAMDLANRYNLEPYIKQRLMLIREEIENVFGGVGGGEIPVKQFNLSKFM